MRRTTYGERIEAFAGSLVSFGVPAAYALNVARGMMDQLHRWCWDNNTDLLGFGADVDAITNWTGAEGVVAEAMAAAGLVHRLTGNEFFLPTALKWAPQSVRRRWERRAKEKQARYVNIMERSRQADVPRIAEQKPVPWTPPAEPQHDFDTNLFGEHEPPAKEPPTDDEAIAGYQAVVKHWFDAYADKYGRRYTFRAKDGKNLKRLIGQIGPDALIEAIDAYLACTDPFFSGHEIDFLVGRINRWTSQSAPTGEIKESRQVRRLR